MNKHILTNNEITDDKPAELVDVSQTSDNSVNFTRLKNRTHRSVKVKSFKNWIEPNIRGMFKMNCLFLSGDFKFQVSPEVLNLSLEVLPVAKNAKFRPMYPLLEGVTVP